MKKQRRKNFEIRFCEAILEKRPNCVGVLISLGDTYTKGGFYQEGLGLDRRLAGLRPEDPVIRYNLACSLSLIGQSQEALGELKKAILLGYDEYPYILRDSDLENVRKLASFKIFFNKLKNLKKE